jgi:uncharacterized protein YjdB
MNNLVVPELRKPRKLLDFIFAILVLGFSGCDGFFIDPQLVSITVSPPSPSLVKGNTQQFTAVGTYDDSTTKVLGDVTWSSSNAGVVYVNSTGLGTAVAIGTATITASSGTAIGSTTVSVIASPLTTLQINPINPSISLSTQNTQQFAAIAVFADGSTMDITNSVTWTSSNTSVATISSTGLATASSKGTTTIGAASGTVIASTTLTVTQ